MKWEADETMIQGIRKSSEVWLIDGQSHDLGQISRSSNGWK